jgi:Domain of Unknown Function (DUF928)
LAIMKYQGLIRITGAIVLAISSAGLPGNPAQASLFTPPPNQGTVNEATGGASRGMFAPKKGNGTVNEATGGASRGMFAPKKGNGTVNEATGGASRGSMFTAAPSRRTLRESTGGASRGLFTPKRGSGIVREATGGASRGLFARSRGKGVVKESTGGGSRTPSYNINPSMLRSDGPAAMMALLPQTYSGTTLLDRPTLFVYLPASEAKTMVFSLQDDVGNVQYQTTLPVSSEAGIHQITLPAEAPALQEGQNYQWFLALKIDDELSPRTPYVDGWIQRIAATPEIAQALQSTDRMARAGILGKNGIWYDYAAEIASLQVSQPQNQSAQKEWQELLADADLKTINQAPIVAIK